MRNAGLLAAVLAGGFLCPVPPAVADSGIAKGAPAELQHRAEAFRIRGSREAD